LAARKSIVQTAQKWSGPILLMEEILHHLGCTKPCKYLDIYIYLPYQLVQDFFHQPYVYVVTCTYYKRWTIRYMYGSIYQSHISLCEKSLKLVHNLIFAQSWNRSIQVLVSISSQLHMSTGFFRVPPKHFLYDSGWFTL